MSLSRYHLAEGDIPNTRDKRLFLTGASGLLGRSVMRVFEDFDWIVYGTALTRVTPELHRVDLTNKRQTEDAILDFKPTFLIHCAAQRYPEKVDSDYEAAARLNVGATEMIAQLCYRMGVPMLYISTDYVFDGQSPPYQITDPTNPLNLYGKTKLLGEIATLEQREPGAGSANLVLRIPVLYGTVERLEESAVTSLLTLLLDRTQCHEVSDYELRRPAPVCDIANLCYLLALERFKSSSVNGIFHWCGSEVFTKYGLVKLMAEMFKLPLDHIIPVKELPSMSQTARPYDTTLDTSRTLQVVTTFQPQNFKSQLGEALLPFVPEQELP